MKYFVSVNGTDREVTLESREGCLVGRVAGREHRLEWRDVDGLGQYAFLVDGRAFAFSIDEEGEGRLRVGLAGAAYAVAIEDERERASHAADPGPSGAGPAVVKSRIPGIVVAVLAKPGETVEAGAPLLVLEAMKMQNEIRAPAAGRVKSVFVRTGETVAAGQALALLAAGPPEPGG